MRAMLAKIFAKVTNYLTDSIYLLFLVNGHVVVGVVGPTVRMRIHKGEAKVPACMALGGGHHETAHGRWCDGTHACEVSIHFIMNYEHSLL